MKKPIILCVDDEKFVLDSLKTELKDSLSDDYVIETSDGAADALDLFEELVHSNHEVAVVIADYIMPGMNGDELLKEIHDRYPKTLKIMLTGQATTDAVGNAVNYAKLYRYIAKPWDPNDLALTVKEAVRSYLQDKKLDEQNQELKEINATLEQRVIERTRELSDAMQELEATQAQLVHAEKMATVGRLVAGVAHEVNNPISAMKSAADNSERCVTKIEKELDHSNKIEDIRDRDRLSNTLGILKENIQTIEKASLRISALVENLKNFAGLDESDFQIVDIHEGLDSTLDLIRHEIDDDIKVVKKYGDVPPFPCYSNQLNQVFMILLLTAVRSIEQKGKITINTEFTTQDGQDHVVIRISDTGRGIPPEKLKNLFKLGFDAKETRVQFGLEFITVQNIIYRHGGTVDVDSKVGKGTTFTLDLPLKHKFESKSILADKE